MEEYTKADENFHIAASTVFSLANRALEIFESSEVNEKRQLLNFVLQNCRLSGRNLLFEVKSPFQEIILYKDHPTLLGRWGTGGNDFCPRILSRWLERGKDLEPIRERMERVMAQELLPAER